MKLTTKTVTKVVEILPVIEIQFSDLVVFLEEHNALEGYLRGYEISDTRDGLYEFLKKRCSPRGWFTDAFIWSNTQEGHSYWRDLNAEWNSHLDFLEKKHLATILGPEEEN